MDYVFLLNLAIILAVTKLFGMFTRKIHLPQVVGALFAGILLGPALLKVIHPDHVLVMLAEVGVILLMFSAGLETDFKQLRGALKSSLVVALIGITLPLLGGFAVAHFFGQDTMKSFFIGVILTATSVSITAETLQEMGKLNTKAGTVIMGAAVIDDILGIIILSVIISMGGGDMNIGAVGFTLLKICLFFVLALILGYLAFKLFDYLGNKYGNKRRLSIFGVSFCFLLAFLAEQFGVADITGAYFAGLALCACKAEENIQEKSSILSYMFFSPVFFVSVGLMTSFEGLNGNTVLFAFVLLMIAILTKFVGCGLGARLCGHPKDECVQIGAGMISRGEVAIIVAAKGISAGLMEQSLFSSVIMVVIITTLITPVFVKAAFNRKPKALKG
ncbi:MAG: cation:proton antiporter [Oscillospiraceae bacterium]|nr:cation:proton antiporter [Oscillospiraceae bacterium]